MRYEILNGTVVTNIIMASPEFMAENYPESSYRLAVETVPEAPAQRPQLVITGITADAANTSRTVITSTLNDVTCPAGTLLNVSAALQDGASNPVLVAATFRMPIVARDGREKVLLVTLVDGVASFNAPMRESGVWEVTQAIINQGLPAAEQMDFAGITIYVVEAE